MHVKCVVYVFAGVSYDCLSGRRTAWFGSVDEAPASTRGLESCSVPDEVSRCCTVSLTPWCRAGDPQRWPSGAWISAVLQQSDNK